MINLKKTCMIALLFATIILSGLSFMSPNQALAQGGPSPEARAIIQSLSEEERQKFFSMSREDKRAFIQSKLKEKGGDTAKSSSSNQTGASSNRGGGGNSGQSGNRRRRPPPLVELTSVVKEPLVQVFPITGRLVANQRSQVATKIKGSVQRINVQVGDRVKTGQIIAELDIDRLKLEADLKAADVIQARAKWNSAKATRDLLQQELKRLEKLKRSAAFSQARYDDKRQEIVRAEATVEETAAALKRARSSRDLARMDVKDASVSAPFDGVVILKHVSPGAYLNPGSSVVTLLDDGNVEIEADIPSNRLSGVAPGSVVNVRIGSSSIVQAAVRTVIPDENPLSRTRAVRLIPDTSKIKSKLVVNQSVVVEVPEGQAREVVAVHKDAIVNRQSGTIVFVFNNGRVRPTNVQIGEAFAGKFEILSGLEPGQQVVVTGNELLRPGQPVRIKGGGGPGATKGGKGPAGASGSEMTGQQRRAIIQSLSDEERQKFRAMSREEKQEFFKKRAKNSGGPA